MTTLFTSAAAGGSPGRHPGRAQPDRYRTAILAALVCAFALNIYMYSRSAAGPYVMDDMPNLIENDSLIITDFTPGAVWKAAFSSNASWFSRPVSMLSFAANYTLAGGKPSYPVKLTNIMLHVLTAWGIFLLTAGLLPRMLNQSMLHKNTGQANTISLLVTCVWLFHPLFVSTVLYSVQRMAILSAMFTIYGCVFYLRQRDINIAQGHGYITLFAGIILFTLIAFLAKENGALLPGFLLLIETCCFRFARHRAAAWQNRVLAGMLCLPVLFILGYLAYTCISYFDGGSGAYSFTARERILTESRVLWRYLGWLWFLNPEPMGLYHDDIILSTGLTRPLTTLAAMLAWLAVVTAIILRCRSGQVLVFAATWFLWGHVLESTVLPLSLMFEHRNYLPGYGAILGLVVLFVEFTRGSGRHRYFTYPLLVLALVVLPVYACMERSAKWHDEKSLVLALLEQKPSSAKTLILASRFLYDNGDYPHALLAIRQAQQLSPAEPSYILAEAALHCDRFPDQVFDARLVRSILHLPASDTVSVNTIRQLRQLLIACKAASVNYPTLLRLYEGLSKSHDIKLQTLSRYGIGLVNFHYGRYQAGIEAWEFVISKDHHAAVLQPILDEVKREYQQRKAGREGSGVEPRK